MGCEHRADAVPRPGAASEYDAPMTFASPPSGACLPGASASGPIDVAGLVEKIRPTVVSVQGSRTLDLSDWHEMLGLPVGPSGPSRVERAVGSGVLIAAEGLVLTNDHVVESAFDIEVRLADERAFEAKVVGRDPKLDVALLKLRDAAGLPVAALGRSDAVRVGDRAIVIGNPFGLGPTVTLGIVSATSREVEVGPFGGFLQTDAAINPGNSGGPLFDEAGQVIGIATAIHAQGQGIGFAIPVDQIREVLPELQSKGRVVRGRMGVAFQEITLEIARALRLRKPAGALVTDVEAGSPAAAAGIRPGDVIVGMDAARFVHARELARALGKRKPGEKVTVAYQREGEGRTVSFKLDLLDEEVKLDPPAGRPSPGAGGVLGMVVGDGPEGARIEGLDPRGALARELEVGDLVLEVNGAMIRSGSELTARLRTAPPGADLLLRVRRDGNIRYLVVQAPS